MFFYLYEYRYEGTDEWIRSAVNYNPEGVARHASGMHPSHGRAGCVAYVAATPLDDDVTQFLIVRTHGDLREELRVNVRGVAE